MLVKVHASSATRDPTPGQRLFAWALARFDRGCASVFAERKRLLLAEASGDVVEIGPGAGANLAYLPPGVRWIGIEPNPAMHAYLVREAHSVGISVDLRHGVAEALPLPAESADVVISTHVLCSVNSLDASLSEIVRVLRPGGRFLFFEHVGADAGTRLRRWQRLIKPLWRRACGGCEPDRDIAEAIETAGFAGLEMERFDVALPLVRPHVMGAAQKRSGP
jgi:SAM-dependent methyltransferase